MFGRRNEEENLVLAGTESPVVKFQGRTSSYHATAWFISTPFVRTLGAYFKSGVAFNCFRRLCMQLTLI
jgi:hypothetical protein